MAKTPANIRSLARAHTEKALNVLAGIMNEPEAQAAARVSAAKELLDRGWGKATQIIDATINDKRDAADWTRSELVAFIHDATKGGAGTPAEDGREGQPDSVH